MYKVILDSIGPLRSFSITCGLREGYGDDAITHTPEEAVMAAEAWMRRRAAAGRPLLTGTVTTGTVVYAWPEGEGKAGSGNEPCSVFSGEVSHLYASAVSDDDVWVMLGELAAELGAVIGQTRIYVAYRDEVLVLQKETAETPTGETV